jgi:pyruvate,water dikinase
VTLLVWLDDDGARDASLTGAKFAMLASVHRWPPPDRREVPDGAALSTAAWHRVIEHNGLRDMVDRALAGDDAAARLLSEGLASAELPPDVRDALGVAVTRLTGAGVVEFAVRSSAVDEDLAGRTFAGQYLTRLSVRDEAGAARAYLDCLASAWSAGNRRYRERTADGAPDDPSMAVIVQAMAHIGDGWAGAALSDGVGGVTVEVVRGLGDELMSGRADPLRWTVAAGEEPDGALAQAVVGWVRRCEQRIGHAVEVEFSVRSDDPAPVVLQVRAHRPSGTIAAGPTRWHTARGEVNGLAIGVGHVRGPVCRLDGPDEIDRLVPGGVLVATSTDPGWLPLLGGVGAVVTDHGGLTSHAAIVCRELGILAVVGCGDATRRLVHGAVVDVRCEGPTGSVLPVSPAAS